MNPHIEKARANLLGVYELQRATLQYFSTGELRALVNECDDLRHHGEFSVQAAAEITRAAATMVLDQRK